MTQPQTYSPPARGKTAASQPGKQVAAARSEASARVQQSGHQPAKAARQHRHSTPRLLSSLQVISTLLALIFGVGSLLLMLATRTGIHTAAHDAEQFIRIQNIEASLLSAHARAANAFLIGGAISPTDREAFGKDLVNVAGGIVDASNAQPGDREALAKLNADLTVYVQQIEGALTSNQQGIPVATTYLDEAARTLQDKLLPTLEALSRTNSQRIDEAAPARSDIGRFWIRSDVRAWLTVGLGAVWFGTLLTSLILTARRTHRVINLGLVIAALLVLTGTLLAASFMNSASSTIESARSVELSDVRNAATARVHAYQAKANESLALITGTSSGSEAEHRWQVGSSRAREAMSNLTPALRKAPSDAFDEYVAVHRHIHKLAQDGDHRSAIQRATSSSPEGSNAIFSHYDKEISRIITTSGTQAATSLRSSSLGLLTAAISTLFLSVLAAGSARWGLSQRLKEYR